MSIKLNSNLNAEVNHSPSTIPLSGKRTKPPAQAMRSALLPLSGNLQAVAAQVRPKLWQNVTRTMASLALGTAVALIPMVGQARPIMTWNLNGATRFGDSSWERIFETMNAPGGGVQPIEVAAIQEAGRLNPAVLRGLGAPTTITVGNATVLQYEIQRGGATFRIYWTLGDLGATTQNALAIVLRNPRGATRAGFVANPNGPRIQGATIALERNRPALGVVDTNGAYYFTFHATNRQGDDTRNDAAQLAAAILEEVRRDNGPNNPVPNIFIGADVNRNLTAPTTAFPAGALPQALPAGLRAVAPAGRTFNARQANPESTLDGFIVNTRAQGNTPELGLPLITLRDARTARFPSDHFPVAYDDRLPNNAGTPAAGVPVPIPAAAAAAAGAAAAAADAAAAAAAAAAGTAAGTPPKTPPT
jgi:hypothetical protein